MTHLVFLPAAEPSDKTYGKVLIVRLFHTGRLIIRAIRVKASFVPQITNLAFPLTSVTEEVTLYL
jgi:hypothetical protein